MIGCGEPTNALAAIAAVPMLDTSSAAHPPASQAPVQFRLQNTPANATNHTSTDRSTCTTSATWKKSTSGNTLCTQGVREATSSTENKPAPMSEITPSINQPKASRARASRGTARPYATLGRLQAAGEIRVWESILTPVLLPAAQANRPACATPPTRPQPRATDPDRRRPGARVGAAPSAAAAARAC